MAKKTRSPVTVSAGVEVDEFEVGHGGALRPAGFAEPVTREDLYFLTGDDMKTPKKLAFWMDHCGALASEMMWFHDDWEGEAPEPPPSTRRRPKRPLTAEEQTRAWVLQANEQFFTNTLVPHVSKWLREPWGPWEEDAAMRRSGQEAALRYFDEMGHAARQTLGVVCIEGECPGSTYFAAELRRPIKEANRAAKAAGLPVRFVKARKGSF